MKHHVTKFKTLKIALKELEPFIRNGEHLRTGKTFKKFNGMRSREMLGNWLICAAKNSTEGSERYTFTSDPVDGDGVVLDSTTGNTWRTEHVMVPPFREGETHDIYVAILDAVTAKQKKGGAAYAAGKTLVVFLEAGGNTQWYPNLIAKKLPETDFGQVLIVGLQYVEQNYGYVYGVTAADITGGNAPTWKVRINPDFEGWQIEQLQ